MLRSLILGLVVWLRRGRWGGLSVGLFLICRLRSSRGLIMIVSWLMFGVWVLPSTPCWRPNYPLTLKLPKKRKWTSCLSNILFSRVLARKYKNYWLLSSCRQNIGQNFKIYWEVSSPFTSRHHTQEASISKIKTFNLRVKSSMLWVIQAMTLKLYHAVSEIANWISIALFTIWH